MPGVIDKICSLPYELTEHIIQLSLSMHPIPSHIACVSSAWAAIALPLLYEQIRLTSLYQLRLFVAYDDSENENTRPGLPHCQPWQPECSARGRKVEIRLPGGTPSNGMWAMIQLALDKCQRCTAEMPGLSSPNRGCTCRGVRELHLCLNSHLGDPDLSLIYPALSQINPRVFSWKGPDPEHHFSTAIIPNAANFLCKAMRNWSALQSLHLSNIAFLYDGHELVIALQHIEKQQLEHVPDSAEREYAPCPGLIQLTISQAVCMHPQLVLSVVLQSRTLKECRLIDVYQHSIWGPRLRLTDVEQLLATDGGNLQDNNLFGNREWDKSADLKRVRRVLRCVTRNERLMGGDRE